MLFLLKAWAKHRWGQGVGCGQFRWWPFMYTCLQSYHARFSHCSPYSLSHTLPFAPSSRGGGDYLTDSLRSHLVWRARRQTHTHTHTHTQRLTCSSTCARTHARRATWRRTTRPKVSSSQQLASSVISKWQKNKKYHEGDFHLSTKSMLGIAQG